MTQTNEQSSAGGWVILFLGFAFIVGSIDSCSGPSGSTGGTSASSSYSGTPEHRYATERFRQEGLSDSEARQAADAVIKFHNAQKNR